MCRLVCFLLLLGVLAGCNTTRRAEVVALPGRSVSGPVTPVSYTDTDAAAYGPTALRKLSTATYEDRIADIRTEIVASKVDYAYEDYWDSRDGSQDWGLNEHDYAPDFEWDDSYGYHYALSDFRARRQPVLVYFFNGGWSPTSIAQLTWLRDSYPVFHRSGIEVVAITTERPYYVTEIVRRYRLQFPVYSDYDYRIVRAYRVAYQPEPVLSARLGDFNISYVDHYGSEQAWLPLNSLYLVGGDGRLVWRNVAAVPSLDLGFDKAVRVASSLPLELVDRSVVPAGRSVAQFSAPGLTEAEKALKSGPPAKPAKDMKQDKSRGPKDRDDKIQSFKDKGRSEDKVKPAKGSRGQQDRVKPDKAGRGAKGKAKPANHGPDKPKHAKPGSVKSKGDRDKSPKDPVKGGSKSKSKGK